MLHLIEPLGFNLDDRALRRAGLDYHEYATLNVHTDFASFKQTQSEARMFALTTRGEASVYETQFEDGDVFLFGPETRGLPADIREGFPSAQLLRIPMQSTSRSLNLSNAVAVVVYEAWRQLGFKR